MTYKAFAKVNIFLKIVGTRGNYHEILSRFMLVDSLYDTLSFVPKKTKDVFELVGDFNCKLEQNTIFKAANALKKAGFEKEVDGLMGEFALKVEKKIPVGAGLGGGSSDCATFLRMLNDALKLGLGRDDLMKIGSLVGADVAFFASEFLSANVSGIGEIVEPYTENALNIEVFTPSIFCDTALVYKTYREYFIQNMNLKLAEKMFETSSDALLLGFCKEELNDLYEPSLMAYKDLSLFAKDGWFFSGSGSSFFRKAING